MAKSKKGHINYCLDCKTRNCYNRGLGPKAKDCLEIDYKDEIRLASHESALIDKVNTATKAAFRRKAADDFALNWLIGFIRAFFGDGITVGIATCLGATEMAGNMIRMLEKEGIKTALVTCKLGGLTIDNTGRDGRPYLHPGCNPVAQAKILNKLKVPVVVLVSLCIGHDMLFIKNCDSYVIPFRTKVPVGYGPV